MGAGGGEGNTGQVDPLFAKHHPLPLSSPLFPLIDRLLRESIPPPAPRKIPDREKGKEGEADGVFGGSVSKQASRIREKEGNAWGKG